MSNYPLEMQYGEIIIAFTNSFIGQWNSSGLHHEASFFKPVISNNLSSDYRPLGSMGIQGLIAYNPSTAQTVPSSWAMLVRPSETSSENPPALVSPQSFNLLWTTTGISHGKNNHRGACWQMVAPAGYIAMGDVFITGSDPNNKPNINDYWCVREDLTLVASVGERIWNDYHSGKSNDLSIYSINCPDLDNIPDDLSLTQTMAAFSANTFYANTSLKAPSGPFFCLYLPVPITLGPNVKTPELSSYNPPPSIFGKTLDRSITVPFTAIVESNTAYTLDFIVNNMPFYTLERFTYYLLGYNYLNKTGSPYTSPQLSITTGVSTTTSDTMSHTAGIELYAEKTFGLKSPAGASSGGKASIKLSYQFKWSKTNTQSLFQETTTTSSYTVNANTLFAEYELCYSLLLIRGDQTNADTFIINSNNLGGFTFPAAKAPLTNYKSVVETI